MRDLSLNGMQIAAGAPLQLNQIVKIDSAACAAIARVAHCKRERSGIPGAPERWIVGVEFLTLRFRTHARRVRLRRARKTPANPDRFARAPRSTAHHTDHSFRGILWHAFFGAHWPGSSSPPPRSPRTLRAPTCNRRESTCSTAACSRRRRRATGSPTPTSQEVSLSVASFLIVHPRGVLMWDAGAVADHERSRRPRLRAAHLAARQPRAVREARARRSCRSSRPRATSRRDVTHLALSHYHWDHTADANLFAGATWLASKVEHDAMFSADPPGGSRPETFSALKNSKTVLITEDEHDVFGDGTRDHQAGARPHRRALRAVREAREDRAASCFRATFITTPPSARSAGLPTFEVSEEQTKAARAEVEAFLKRTGAQLWIQHDLAAFRKLKLAPQYYD